MGVPGQWLPPRLALSGSLKNDGIRRHRILFHRIIKTKERKKGKKKAWMRHADTRTLSLALESYLRFHFRNKDVEESPDNILLAADGRVVAPSSSRDVSEVSAQGLAPFLGARAVSDRIVSCKALLSSVKEEERESGGEVFLEGVLGARRNFCSLTFFLRCRDSLFLFR